MKKNIFLEIINDVIFFKGSFHSFVRFFERFYQTTKLFVFKFHNNKPLEVGPKGVYLSNLHWSIITNFKALAWLVNDQPCLQQKAQRFSYRPPRGTKAKTDFLLSKSLVWFESSIYNSFTKVSEYIIGNRRWKFG